MSDYIPDGLVIEILARLPVASLLRFKAVCKQWYHLITSPSFVTKHRNQSVNGEKNGSKLLVKVYGNNSQLHESCLNYEEAYLLLNDNDKFGDEYSVIDFPFRQPFGYLNVVSSCNGLLLCLDNEFVIDQPEIIICNPSTRKSATLPRAYEPQHPHIIVYGFGAHPLTHEYKVVTITYEKDIIANLCKLPPKAAIYSQGTRAWRSVSSAVPPYYIFNRNWSQAFIGGAIHWLACNAREEGDLRNSIMLLNMASESFDEFKLPPALADQPTTSLSIKTFRQSLAVLCSGPRDIGGCCVWAMQKYGVAESWTKLYTSNLLGPPNKTLGFRKNGEVLVAAENHLVSYAPETQTLATTGFRRSSHAFYVDPFVETLFLV